MGVDFAKAALGTAYAASKFGLEGWNFATPSIADYDERRAKQLEFWKSQDPPPRRFIAGVDAVAPAEEVAANLKAQTEAYRDLSSSLAFDPKPAARVK
jgi:hypothetical protein